METKNKKWIMANWKMNGSLAMVEDYIKVLQQSFDADGTELVILPPAVYLSKFQKTGISLGAQNVSAEENGAFTGEISALMLKELGCQYILVGHSERRQYFTEDDEFIAKKFHKVQEHGMTPVICIGETLEQYQAGKTLERLSEQLYSLKQKRADFSFKKCIIAYEPVWAIGSGLTPTNKEIAHIMQKIREIVAEIDVDAAHVPTLYGGSVNEHNIAMINAIENCDGVLIGGASLKVKQLLEIAECITCY